MANLTSELANWFSLSTYPITRATITRGRRSESVSQRSLQVLPWHTNTQREKLKDTDSKHIDPINSVFVVVPVCSMVAAQQGSGLIALMLQFQVKSTKTEMLL